MGGKAVGFWAFDASNVLKWDNEAGTSAWLQFCVLPGGPVFLGALHDAAASAPVAGARPFPLKGRVAAREHAGRARLRHATAPWCTLVQPCGQRAAPCRLPTR